MSSSGDAEHGGDSSSSGGARYNNKNNNKNNTRKISRRDFLKLMGAGAAALVVGRFIASDILDAGKNLGGNNNNNNGGGSMLLQADAQTTTVPPPTTTSGSWMQGPDCPVIAVHSCLLPDGRLLLVQGSGYHLSFKSGPFRAVMFDADSGTQQTFDLQEDIFCCNLNHLANGNILFTGGTKAYDIDTPNGMFWGLNSVYEFNVATNTFTKLASLAHGKWYPTQVVLSDGRVVNRSGLDEFGASNALTEVYNPATKTHSIVGDATSTQTYCVGEGTGVSGSGTPCFNNVVKGISIYPRMHLLPSGLVFISGMSNALYVWNPSNGQYTAVGSTIFSAWRDYGTSFLLPLQNTTTERGMVLIAGGNPNSAPPATDTAEIFDFNSSTDGVSPAIRSAPKMNFARRYLLPIILPTGDVVIFGGTGGSSSDFIKTPDMYDPVANAWRIINAPATIGRTYHSVAILLPDGRVWVGSGTPSATEWEPRTEIFRPWYFGIARPAISGPPVVGPYNGTITIPTQNASDISSVSLVRLMATTHHHDANQRLLWLPITSKDSSSVTVKAPLNGNLAPPGPYMIHILNGSRVPSTSRIITIPGIATGGGTSSSGDHPQITITAPAAGAVLTGPSSGVPVTVRGTASDAGGQQQINLVTVALDSQAAVNAVPVASGDWSSWSQTFTVTGRGQHTIRAAARNASGSTTSTQIRVRVYPTGATA
jgi:hypothetical protein